MLKRYIALARVSSREQEREGFSLDVQEDALKRYAERNGGEIVKFYRIAETASKHTERKTFKEMLAHTRKNATILDGLLFYKVDRAARNLFDYVELERLEADCGVETIYVSQLTENSPAGRMQRRILANMAAFYTEQQSIDVREGHARRVESGLFVNKAPYGYRNVRIDGRSLVKVHPHNGPNIRRLFELYAYRCHTLDSLRNTLQQEEIHYTDSTKVFTRSKLYSILRDRSYIGEVWYKESWHSGSHEPLIDLATFRRVQVLLGNKTYNAHTSVYGAGMITCRHCSRPVVVEVKTKKTKRGPREYRYYRCAGYKTDGHPSIRLREADLDRQVLSMFAMLRIEDKAKRAWIGEVLRARAKGSHEDQKARQSKLRHQQTRLENQLAKLLDMRLAEEIDGNLFGRKRDDLLKEKDEITLHIEAASRQYVENAELAINTFELSQCLEDKWLSADIAEKRQLLKIVCLNFFLDGVSLVPEMRKPFDVLAKRPSVSTHRGDRI